MGDKEKTIYDLKLHETFHLLQYTVTRVAGGWLYCREEPQVNIAIPVFVPFNDEFQLEKSKFE